MEEITTIEVSTRGTMYYEHQTSICFTINGKDYWFDMIEKGCSEDGPGKGEVTFIPDDVLPFELTEEIQDEMYILAWEH